MLLVLLAACSDSTVTSSPGKDDPVGIDSGDTADSGDTGDTGTVDGCRAAPAAADRERRVFVSLPYTKNGGKAKNWAMLPLSEEGELGEPTVFSMGNATAGEAVFTPDASIGVAPLSDGTVGVFTGDGTVIEASFDAGLYAVRAVPDPTGEGFWLLDGDWAEYGGGVWWLPIDCETGEPSTAERIVPAKLPADLLFFGDRALVVGRDVAGSVDGADVALLDWATTTTVSSADAFGDDDAIVSDAARTADGDWALVCDFSEFSGVSARVARLALDGDTVTAAGVVDVEDPVSVVTAPTGTVALVLSGYGNAAYTLDAATGALAEVAYSGTSPQLPGAAVELDRGTLAGSVFVSETEGIRQLHFDGDSVVDDGLFAFDSGLEWLPGAIGVTP